MRQLLPPRARVGLERLEQMLTDVTTALTRPKRPPATRPHRTTSRPAAPEPAREAPAQNVAAQTSVTSETPSAEPQSDASSDIRHRVVFEHLDQEVLVGPDQSILDAGREAGLDLEFSCTVGGCAACALQIVDGDVVYDVPTCLTDDERESGICLACVGRPAGDLILTTRF